MNRSALFMVVAAVYGLTAVILGALGTHAFGLVLGSREAALFQHAFIYQLVHALLLFGVGTQLHHGPWVRYAAWSLTLGVLGFCGGLYLLVFVGKTNFSWITPVGGSLIILAWLNLVIHGILKFKSSGNEYKP
ncbi:DUF423 domain-containing protein [Marinicella marina]|uniref:DUF423 domain-containing protein n=1 Tax=Marinicella marina TaxID=2996016 RepID=UPI0024BC88FE|nr:DUF423 domain-containing protein [Marinicella marina]